MLVESLPQGRSITVCVLTGHGLKDPQVLSRKTSLPRAVSPTFEDVSRAVESVLA